MPARLTYYFVSPDAEFTPKTVGTHAELVTVVYHIRIGVAGPTRGLVPGMLVDTGIPLPLHFHRYGPHHRPLLL